MNKFLLPLLIFLSGFLEAKTIFVNQGRTGPQGDGTSWNKSYTDIKIAIEAARNGDEVWVTDWIYTLRNQNLPESQLKIYINHSVKVYGGFKGFETSLHERGKTLKTIISGKSSFGGDTSLMKNLVIIGKSLNVTFDQITFSHVNSTGADYQNGGAILIDTLSTVNFKRCQFSDNKAPSRVSCITSTGGTRIKIDSCLFTGNHTSYSLLFGNDNSKYWITNTEITGNGLAPDNFYYYFYINKQNVHDHTLPYDTLMQVNNVNFHANDLNFVQQFQGSVICKNSTFDLNKGNAIYTVGTKDNMTYIENCTFKSSPRNYVVYNVDNFLTLKNCEFDGAGKTYNTGIVYTTSSLALKGTTFKNFNYTMIGMYPSDSSYTVDIDGCTFENNSYDLFTSNYRNTPIRNTRFINNNLSNSFNSVINVYGKKLQLENCEFTGNKVGTNRSLLSTTSLDTILIHKCKFSKNETKNWPLITISKNFYTNATQNRFEENFSQYNYTVGGIIWSVYGKLHSAGNLYKNNFSEGENSCGVANIGSDSRGQAIFFNDIFDGNKGDSSAAFINNGFLHVANSDFVNHPDIIVKNKVDYGGAGKAEFTNCIIFYPTNQYFLNGQGLPLNFTNCYASYPLPGKGNIVSTIPPVDENYRPTITRTTDAGTTLPDSVVISKVDYFGNPRIVGTIDIGAAEYSTVTTTNKTNGFSDNHFYPNPCNAVTLNTSLNGNSRNVHIYNLKGEKLKEALIQNDNIELSDLPSGLYFFQVQEGNQIITEKVTIVK